jgi:hypothetical protein
MIGLDGEVKQYVLTFSRQLAPARKFQQDDYPETETDNESRLDDAGFAVGKGKIFCYKCDSMSPY